jgi:hypothetical protein
MDASIDHGDYSSELVEFERAQTCLFGGIGSIGFRIPAKARKIFSHHRRDSAGAIPVKCWL